MKKIFNYILSSITLPLLILIFIPEEISHEEIIVIVIIGGGGGIAVLIGLYKLDVLGKLGQFFSRNNSVYKNNILI